MLLVLCKKRCVLIGHEVICMLIGCCRRGVSPLHCAVSNGKREIVRLLLEAGAQVNVRGHRSDRTPLFMAAEVGDLETARLLLQHGAKLNLTDQYGL